MLNIDKTALVVVDMQEAFRHPINEFAQIVERASIAIRGFQILDLPVIITEQYPKGLGRTAEELLLCLPDDCEIFEKSTFSSCGASGFLEKLRELNIKQVVLCGLETHVCINQTAHDLLKEGFQVHILRDAVASRFSKDRKAALLKMQVNGVVPSCVEMALFELLRDSKHEHFRAIQNLIK